MDCKNIIFVTPWYGKDAIGGAETLCKLVIEHLNAYKIPVEVFTTCSKEFNSDWTNNLKPGQYDENGVTVTRFKVDNRNTGIFNSLNQKILSNQTLDENEEKQFFENNINSSDMMDSILKDKSSIFVFIPYLYGTTFFGAQIHPQRSVIIPCLHDEGYAKMFLMKKLLSNVSSLLFNSNAEKILAQQLLKTIPKNQVIGLGIEPPQETNPENFKRKFNLDKFILCSGRKETGKNTPLLIKYFCKYLEQNNSDLKLVLTGKGQTDIPQKFSKNILDIFLSKEDLYNAFQSATLFCMPSINESFSIVLMESWAQKTPVLVHENCSVTKEHCLQSNGGLYFSSFEEFEECVKFYLENQEIREKIGINGFEYVQNNYSWEKIINQYLEFFESL
jgi:glycosyltransferase involved in cell wall biosynthesis